MNRLATAFRSLMTALSAGSGERGRLQIPISDATHALLADLAVLTEQPDHVHILRNALSLHTAIFDATADGSEILFRGTDGTLVPLRPGAGPIDEIHEDRQRVLHVQLADHVRAKMDHYAAASGCRDLCDLVVHALRSYRTAIAMTAEQMTPVRRSPNGVLDDFPLFRNA